MSMLAMQSIIRLFPRNESGLVRNHWSSNIHRLPLAMNLVAIVIGDGSYSNIPF